MIPENRPLFETITSHGNVSARKFGVPEKVYAHILWFSDSLMLNFGFHPFCKPKSTPGLVEGPQIQDEQSYHLGPILSFPSTGTCFHSNSDGLPNRLRPLGQRPPRTTCHKQQPGMFFSPAIIQFWLIPHSFPSWAVTPNAFPPKPWGFNQAQ